MWSLPNVGTSNFTYQFYCWINEQKKLCTETSILINEDWLPTQVGGWIVTHAACHPLSPLIDCLIHSALIKRGWAECFSGILLFWRNAIVMVRCECDTLCWQHGYMKCDATQLALAFIGVSSKCHHIMHSLCRDFTTAQYLYDDDSKASEACHSQVLSTRHSYSWRKPTS